MPFVAALNASQIGNKEDVVIRVSSNEPVKEIISNIEEQENFEQNEKLGNRTKSFLEATREGTSVGVPLRVSPLRVEGGNIIVKIDEEDIEKETQRYQFNIIEG